MLGLRTYSTILAVTSSFHTAVILESTPLWWLIKRTIFLSGVQLWHPQSMFLLASLGQRWCSSSFFPLRIFFRWYCCALPWNPQKKKKKSCSLYCNLMICMYCGNPYSELTAVILHRLQRERRWFVQSVQTLRVNFTSGSDAFSEGFFHLPCVCVCLCVCVCVCVCVGMFGAGQEIFPFNLLNYAELTCGYENL